MTTNSEQHHVKYLLYCETVTKIKWIFGNFSILVPPRPEYVLDIGRNSTIT